MAKNTSNDLFDSENETDQAPVECLGMTFPNDQARREYFLEKLREKLKDPEFRQIEGFPIGEDEDILAMSDPPYYTACPNPFISELINSFHGREYVQDPELTAFADDVSGGKHSAAYHVHPYHTKVPPEAILPLLRHYTRPGDFILDPFAGSGMTGVAVDLLNAKDATASPRSAILVDIGVITGFIAGTYNSGSDGSELLEQFDCAIEQAKENSGTYFQTDHTGWPKKTTKEEAVNSETSRGEGTIIYTVWSDIFCCPQCGGQVPYWDVAVNIFECSVLDSFPCPHCSAKLCKESKYQKRHSASMVERYTETWHDPILNKVVSRQKRKPVLISYEYNGSRYEKWPDERDLKRISLADQLVPPLPATDMMFKGEQWGDTWRAGVHTGITYAHHFFTNRAAYAIAQFLSRTEHDRRLWFGLTATLMRSSRLNRYMPQHRDNRSREVVGPLSGTLYVPAIGLELNPLEYMRTKRLSHKWFQAAIR